MERGLNWGEYHDKDLVVVGKGSHSGEIGRVEPGPDVRPILFIWAVWWS